MSEQRIGKPLRAALRAGRRELNARFVETRRRLPSLQAEDFQAFLCRHLDPLADQVGEVFPERVHAVVQAAFEVGLELVGRRLLGPQARNRWLEEGWRRLCPVLVAHIAQAPQRMLASLSNALQLVAVSPGVDAELWISTLEQVVPQCRDTDQVLAVGQVAAWRSGMAHFRLPALEVAKRLPASLALVVLGLPVDAASIRGCPTFLARLAEDPWHDPSGRRREPLAVGEFRGFGGLFQLPPRVSSWQECLVVESGESRWWLEADLFGHTLHGASADGPFDTSDQHPALATLNLTAWADCGPVTSVATARRTLAITFGGSHRLALLPLPQAGEDS